ncbi:MAG: helix-turn-helix transcriptional regulator [Ardenticatenales bacterium]
MSDDIALRLGRAIKRARAEAGFLQADVAGVCEVSPQYLCDVENGRRLPTREMRERLASALGIPADALHALAAELPGVAYQCATSGLRTIEDAAAFADLVNAALARMQREGEDR